MHIKFYLLLDNFFFFIIIAPLLEITFFQFNWDFWVLLTCFRDVTEKL